MQRNHQAERRLNSSRWHCYDFHRGIGNRERALFWLRWYRVEQRRLARIRLDDFGEVVRTRSDPVRSIFDF